MKPGIAAKITVLALALVLVTVGAIGIMIFTGYDAILVNEELENLGDETHLEAVQLVAGIEALRQDVLFLSATPPIQGLIRAQAADGVDPLDGSTEAEWRDRLADIFTQFLDAKPTYLEARYIGADGEGREFVCVLRSGNALVTAADEELQPRRNASYFQETIQLPAGEVYLSEITLNREHGQVVEPYILVLRAAAPVYTPEEEIFGIVVVNTDFGSTLAGAEHEQQHTLFITNYAGDFLAHPDPTMTFGFELGERRRIQETYPELAALFEPGNSEQEIAFRSEATGRSEAVHFLKVAFDPGRPDRFLGLALAASYDDVVAASTALRSRSISLTGLLIAGSAVLAFFLSRRLTRPLIQITQAVRGFAGSALDTPLPVDARDEIGVLARAFRVMIRQVNERTEALRESQDRYRTLFELAGDAILIVLPPEGDILDANQAAEQLLGYSKEELKKLSGGQIIAPEVVEETNQEWIAQIEDKGYFLLETLWVRKDGSHVPVSVSGKPLEVRGEARIQLIGRDISERVRVEEEIRRRTAQQQALNAIIVSAAAASDLPDLLEAALEHSLQALGLQMGAIWVADQRTARGITPEHIRNLVRVTREERLELGSPVVVTDWSRAGEELSSTLAQVLSRSGIRASITVPIRAEEQSIGGLSVAAPEPRAWLPEEVALLEAVGVQLGAAGERLRLFQETQNHDQMMVRLAAISESLNRPFSVDQVVTAIGQGALTLTKADRGAVYLRQPDDRVLYPWSQGLSTTYLEKVIARLQDIPGGRLLEQTEPILISDVTRMPEEAAIRNLAEAERFRAVCLWPLVYEGRTVAAVGCYFDEPRAWSAGEQEVLAAFARQASVALENARLFENAQRRLEHVQALRDIDMAITASLDLRVTLNVFLDQVLSQLDVDAAAVLLLNPHTQTLLHAADRGFRTNALQHTHLRLGEGYAGRAALERRIVYIPNLREIDEPFARAPLIATEDFITYYALPLIAKGQVAGVLEAFHRVPLEMDPERLEFMDVLATQAAIAVDNASLFDELQRSNVDLTLAYDATLEGWSRAMDLRDKETEGHTQRVTEMTLRLARAVDISSEELVHIRRGALLHDMGKMGIPDRILLKPGPLTDEEWEVMYKHPVFAYEMLAPIAYLRPALDIPYCHHEKWDGSGYPRGLKGEQIPLAARVFAVADVWDALRSDRPYRKAWPEKKVRKHIRAGSGTHFDSQIVEAFLALVADGG